MNLLLASTFDKFGDKIDQIDELNLHQKSVICITTASSVEMNISWLEPEIEPIRKRSKRFETYDIAGKSKETLRENFKSFDVIYVSGGNTYYLLEKVNQSGFRNVLKDKLEQKCLYLGCSAGAVLICPRIDFISLMDDPSKANLTDYKGLSLIDYLILPHIDHPSYGEIANKIAKDLSTGHEKVIGLKDNQAIYIKDNYIQFF